jgi:hypothetical protein
MNLQYISDDKGNKTAVIVPIQDFLKMQEELDELYCISLYDEAKKQPSETVSLADVKKMLAQQKNEITDGL